jgi:hypothetical protein
LTRARNPVITWGSTPRERADCYPCDGLLEQPDLVAFRATAVGAPAPILFRWVCQLRVAPYSYDLIDNLGRRSPRQLTPGVEQLEVGQRWMTIFRLVDFDPGRSVTLLHRGPLFGQVAVTYRVAAASARSSRIVAKVLAKSRFDFGRRAFAALLGVGDVVMMRRQLLNLKALAEQDAR